jgi:hypothetical protein
MRRAIFHNYRHKSRVQIQMKKNKAESRESLSWPFFFTGQSMTRIKTPKKLQRLTAESICFPLKTPFPCKRYARFATLYNTMYLRSEGIVYTDNGDILRYSVVPTNTNSYNSGIRTIRV